jgi:hypothetical protein
MFRKRYSLRSTLPLLLTTAVSERFKGGGNGGHAVLVHDDMGNGLNINKLAEKMLEAQGDWT